MLRDGRPSASENRSFPDGGISPPTLNFNCDLKLCFGQFNSTREPGACFTISGACGLDEAHSGSRHHERDEIRQTSGRRTRPTIGIGGSLAAPPLPHHRTYGSVYGGSVRLTHPIGRTRSTPSQFQKRLGSAMLSAGLRLRRHGPWALAAV